MSTCMQNRICMINKMSFYMQDSIMTSYIRDAHCVYIWL